MKHTKVLLVGPFPNPISGVSIANLKVEEILENERKFMPGRINMSFPDFNDKVGAFSIKKLLFFVGINFKALKVLSFDKIYITPGQSYYGILKYVVIILLSSLLGKEIIIHVHGNYLHQQYEVLSGIKKRIFRFLISRCKKGIVLSDSLRKNLSLFINPESIFVIPNFAEDNLLGSNNEKSDDINIIYLSNLMEEKGIFQFLEAMEILNENSIKFNAKVAGDIDQTLRHDLLKRMGKINNLEYLGIVKDGEKQDLLNWGTVFILPTFYRMEGQPISILEAYATSNLVLTTNHAGIPDIFEDEVNGYYIEKQSATSIVQKIEFLNKNKAILKTIGVKNKRYAQSNFSQDIFKRKIIECLSS
jgi:glycosyltransferase involved in cell wall biosynthesis